MPTSVAVPASIVVAGVFGCVAYLGAVLGRAAGKSIVPFEDGPRQGKPPVVALILASALLGASVSRHGASLLALALTAVVILVLVAAWVCDVLCGIIPDAFTLAPLLGLIIVRSIWQQWDFLFAGAFVFLPFAILAVCSKGTGMGWGDVKLATFGGVLLGTYAAMWCFLLASSLAVIVAFASKRRSEPIAFGPYLAGAIGLALAAGVPNA
jgi:prepilin signal peptidase PulO-like enzyme (type II secretory pathway)